MGKTKIIYSKKGKKHRKYDDYEIAGFESFDKGNKKRKQKSNDFGAQKNKPKNPTIPTEIAINTAIVKQAKNLRVPMLERIIHARTIIENPTLLSPKEQKFLEHYSKFISDKNKRPFFYKFATTKFDENLIERYMQSQRRKGPIDYTFFDEHYPKKVYEGYIQEIEKANWFASKENQAILIAACEKNLIPQFGPDPLTRYGISNNYRVSDIPKDKPSRHSEKFVFPPYPPELRQGIFKAPKIPIGSWTVEEDDIKTCIMTRKYMFKVDDQIMIGEMTIEGYKANNSIQINANSGVKFSVYYRGMEDVKIPIDRADYHPLSKHPNKFTTITDEAGKEITVLAPNGVDVPFTTFSHRHTYTLESVLAFQQNQSPEISCCPINEGKKPGDKEEKYESFQSFVSDFEKEWAVTHVQISEHELQTTNIKKLGKQYCPTYNTATQTIEPAEKEFAPAKNSEEVVIDPTTGGMGISKTLVEQKTLITGMIKAQEDAAPVTSVSEVKSNTETQQENKGEELCQ